MTNMVITENPEYNEEKKINQTLPQENHVSIFHCELNSVSLSQKMYLTANYIT